MTSNPSTSSEKAPFISIDNCNGKKKEMNYWELQTTSG
jgi:hypothetical protein